MMNRFGHAALASALLLLPAVVCPALAVEAVTALASQPAAGVALGELVQAAVEANPSIAAARAAVGAAQAGSEVASSFADPSFKATWWPEDAAENKQEIWELMLEQGIPFPGTLGSVRKARDAEAAAAQVALERAIRDVTLRVRESAVELEYLRAAGRVAAGNRELLGRLRAAGETAYAAGRAGLYDALRAQSQQSQTLFDERLLAELEATEAARLNSLLNLPPGTAIAPIDLGAGRPLAVGEVEISDLAATGRREVALAREDGNRARAELSVANHEALPGLMLGVGYMQENRLGEMEEANRWKFELGVTLPLNLGKNDGRRAAAAAGEARAAAMEREAANEARALVSENWFRLRNAERLVVLYRDSLLPQAVASLQLADTWYRSGQGSLADLVDAGTLWYSFQLALARAGADREKYLARLEALAERPLTAAAPGATAASAPADEDAWREALRRIEAERESLAAEAASPLVELEVLLPDLERAAALAPAAGDAAAAADVLRSGIALGDVEILALLRSPRVLAAERTFRASLEQYSQVAALDEVVRSYASATGSLMGAVGGGMSGAAAARFPFPGMLALKGEVVSADARAARADLGRARRDALAEARRLWWDIAYARRAADLLGEIVGLQEQSVRAVRARYEAGQGALADLTQAQVALEKARTAVETVVEERRVLEAGLRSLLALPRDAALGPPAGTGNVPPVPDAESLVAVALERRQELRRLRALAERMELMIQMAEREITPGFALEGSLFENQPLLQDGTAAMREPFATVPPAAAGTGTPLQPFSARTAGYVRETRQRLAAMREEIRAEEEATVARVREAWFVFDRAAREERLWSQKVGELTRLASVTQDRAYRAGRATLPEALGASVAARESALEAERRRALLGGAWAGLEVQVGGPLPPAGRER